MYGGAWQWLKCFNSGCSDVGKTEFHLLGEARPPARCVEGALGNDSCPQVTHFCYRPQTWAGLPALQRQALERLLES